MTFQSLGLIEALLKAVRLQGYKTPSTIQQKAIVNSIFLIMNYLKIKSLFILIVSLNKFIN